MKLTFYIEKQKDAGKKGSSVPVEDWFQERPPPISESAEGQVPYIKWCSTLNASQVAQW